MKIKIISFICLLSLCVHTAHAQSFTIGLIGLDAVCPNPTKACIAFDIANAKITPLPVFDMQASTGLVMDDVEQTEETLKAAFQYAKKQLMMRKWSIAGYVLRKVLNVFVMPKVVDMTKGSMSYVDAYRNRVNGIVLPVVDFLHNSQIARTVEKIAIVSNPRTSAERLAEKERKDAFIQQSVLDLVARTLYYKSELEKLKQTDTAMQVANGTADTIGTVHVAMQIKEVQERIQGLEEKILAARIELQAIKNLQAAVPITSRIKEAVDRYGGDVVGIAGDIERGSNLFASLGDTFRDGFWGTGGGSGGGSSGGGSSSGNVRLVTGNMFTSPVYEKIRLLAQNAINAIEYDDYSGYPASWNKVELVDCINQNYNRVVGDKSKYRSTKSKLSATFKEISSSMESGQNRAVDAVSSDPSTVVSSVRDSYNNVLQEEQGALGDSVYATRSALSMVVSSLLVRIQDAIDADQHPAFIAMLCTELAAEAQKTVDDILIAGTEAVDHLASTTKESINDVSNQVKEIVDDATKADIDALKGNADSAAETAALNAKNDIVQAGDAAREVFDAIAQLYTDLMDETEKSGIYWEWTPGQLGHFGVKRNM